MLGPQSDTTRSDSALLVLGRREAVRPVRFNTTQGSHMVLQQAPAKSAVYGTVGAGGASHGWTWSHWYHSGALTVFHQ